MSPDQAGTVPPQSLQPLTADDPTEVGGYRLHARLGAGGMGRVYLSYTPGGRPVALKVVRPELAEDPEFRDRFAQEVASARLIHGLYTAQVVDAGVDAAVPWLATAYVAGPSLQQVVRQYGPLPERTVLLLIAGIAEALQAIHAAGVVHRDLKPANVLLAPDGPRVIDFGIARAADAVALTGTGLRVGSPGFMAPEQALGLPATAATDIFALGALATYIAGGNPPFGDGPEAGALYRAVHTEPDLDLLPPGVAELVGYCLAKQPEARPSTAQLIEAVHRHPAVGGRLRFSDDWLPRQIGADLARHAELAGHVDLADLADPSGFPTPSPSPSPSPSQAQAQAWTQTGEARTLLVPAATARLEAPTAVVAATPLPTPLPTPAPTAAPARGTRRRTALVATTALLLGAFGTAAFLLDDPDDGYPEAAPVAATSSSAPSTAPAKPTATATPTPAPSAPTPSAPAAAPGYTAVYTGVELVSPDHDYEFDLKTGKVMGEETATWFLARTATGFVLGEHNDAYVSDGNRLGTAECLSGLETKPVTRLEFAGLVGKAFCVRGQDPRDVAVVRVLSASPGDGPVKVSLDYYRKG